MKKNMLRILASAVLVLTLVLALASCDMLPDELRDVIDGLLGNDEPCAHTETEMVATIRPTCKATGIGNRVCKACDETVESNVIMEKTDVHTTGEWEILTEPTCLKAGEECRRCTVCKIKVDSAVLPITQDHDYYWGVCQLCKGRQPASTGLQFISNGDGTATLSGIGTCTDTSLMVPETTPDGDTVTGIAASAFKGKTQIVTVMIPDTVTTVGTDAFKDCPIVKATAPAAIIGSLKNNTLGEIIITGTGKIPNGAMSGAAALYAVTISEGVTEIGDNAFLSCSKLNSITMPDSLRKIGKSAFASNLTLNFVRIGSGVTEIASNAFHNCDYLYTVIIPASVKTIDTKAFYQSPRINSVTFEVTEGWRLNGALQDPAKLADPAEAVGILLSTESGPLTRD